MQEERMLIAAYARTSSCCDRGVPIEAQFTSIRSFVARQFPDGHIASYHYDVGVSGKLDSVAPSLAKLIQDIESGRLKIVALVASTIDRFGRNSNDKSRLGRLQKTSGVRVLYADA